MPYDARTQSYYVSGSLTDFTTAANVHTEAGTLPVGQYGTKRFLFTATDNNLLVIINGSFDGGTTFPIEVEAEFAVNVGTPVVKSITDLYTDLQITADPAADGAHGTLSMDYTVWSRASA
jgi:hypothetical protein